VEAHLEHAAGFAEAVARGCRPSPTSPTRAADLGSGGGVPALPLALVLPASQWVLIEAGVRRAAFLRSAVAGLGLGDRVEVVEDRAEVVGRSPTHRGRLDLVVARSFGPPAVVAECAAPLLALGGCAVVSEPPGGVPARWPVAGLAELGMVPGPSLTIGAGTFQVLHQERPCPDRYPRRVGVPVKRPLF
jgi:16S rRNA (guanine527-N7)-methyltransferase